MTIWEIVYSLTVISGAVFVGQVAAAAFERWRERRMYRRGAIGAVRHLR